MILQSSIDSSTAASGTIKAKIHCFSMVSIYIGKNSRGFNILKAEKV